jgi:farnesyl-diphosphate farnesyltransferase
MNLRDSALTILQETSRTFYIPISRLPLQLQEAVASAYLCMRAIDEVEDNSELDSTTKAKILREISLRFQSASENSTIEAFSSQLIDLNLLPEVTSRIGEWALLAPASIAPRIWDATAAMADRMAYWAENHWQVETESDLNCYTFSVAGAVGLLLSDLWAWYDGTRSDRSCAIGFGRGLQAVNIIRNRAEDRTRGVDFFPDGWSDEQMHAYARHNLELAKRYTDALSPGPALEFCKIPLTLAYATLNVMALGKAKLSRQDVMELVQRVMR